MIGYCKHPIKNITNQTESCIFTKTISENLISNFRSTHKPESPHTLAHKMGPEILLIGGAIYAALTYAAVTYNSCCRLSDDSGIPFQAVQQQLPQDFIQLFNDNPSPRLLDQAFVATARAVPPPPPPINILVSRPNGDTRPSTANYIDGAWRLYGHGGFAYKPVSHNIHPSSLPVPSGGGGGGGGGG